VTARGTATGANAPVNPKGASVAGQTSNAAAPVVVAQAGKAAANAPVNANGASITGQAPNATAAAAPAKGSVSGVIGQQAQSIPAKAVVNGAPPQPGVGVPPAPPNKSTPVAQPNRAVLETTPKKAKPLPPLPPPINPKVAQEIDALKRIKAKNAEPSPAAERRRVYQEAKKQLDFSHIEVDVSFNAKGKVKAHGGHFSASPKVAIIPGTETVGSNGVIRAKVNLIGPDGNFYLKTNNQGYSTLTPKTWSLARAKGEMSRAFLNRKFNGKVWEGKSGGVTFHFNPPNATVPLWRGYPVLP